MPAQAGVKNTQLHQSYVDLFKVQRRVFLASIAEFRSEQNMAMLDLYVDGHSKLPDTYKPLPMCETNGSSSSREEFRRSKLEIARKIDSAVAIAKKMEYTINVISR